MWATLSTHEFIELLLSQTSRKYMTCFNVQQAMWCHALLLRIWTPVGETVKSCLTTPTEEPCSCAQWWRRLPAVCIVAGSPPVQSCYKLTNHALPRIHSCLSPSADGLCFSPGGLDLHLTHSDQPDLDLNHHVELKYQCYSACLLGGWWIRVGLLWQRPDVEYFLHYLWHGKVSYPTALHSRTAHSYPNGKIIL